MKKQYFREYKLAKELPGFPVGWPLRWDGTRRRYYLVKPNEYTKHKQEPGFGLEYKRDSYMLEDIEDQPEWFTPVGEAKEFIPPFPSKKDLDEYVDLYFENKLVNDVDVCRALSDLWDDADFQNKLYHFVRNQYNALHGLADEETEDSL